MENIDINPIEKHIVIAVSGSIAAYKACDLVRNITKRGYPVSVMMTGHAEKFVGRTTFQALSGRPVYAGTWEDGMQHIDVKNFAGIFAVVPATANIIGKFANGIADDLVSSTYLALRCPVIIAPAMNPGMYNNAAVQRNLKTLKEDGLEIVDPQDGEVVCGDEGQGKMASVLQLESLLIERYTQVIQPQSYV